MASTKKKEQVLIPSKAIIAEMRGWRPEMGNQEDRWIIEAMRRLEKKLGEVDNKVLRSGKDLTSKMKEILRTEDGIVHSIKRRKMDF